MIPGAKEELPMSRSPRAFTLIELMVVVTIIAILLAILSPALENALYQADLAKCAANLKAIASGAVMYAQSNKLLFPYRDAIETTPLLQASANTTLPTGNNVGGNVNNYGLPSGN